MLDVRGLSQIIVHDGEADASEMITAAAGLVPPVAQFAPTSSQFGSAEVASHRSDDDRRVETRGRPSIISGPRNFRLFLQRIIRGTPTETPGNSPAQGGRLDTACSLSIDFADGPVGQIAPDLGKLPDRHRAYLSASAFYYHILYTFFFRHYLF